MWFDLRKKFLITGSRVPALVGCHYESLNAYYQLKRFGKEKVASSFTSDAMAWGNRNEERAYNRFLEVFPVTGVEWRYSDGMHVWPGRPHVAGSPDGCGYEKGVLFPPWCLEIKCPYYGLWHVPKDPVEMFGNKPQHWIQLQINMACCNSTRGAFWVWDCAPDESEERGRLVTCAFDTDLCQWLDKRIDWWKETLEKDPPAPSLRLEPGVKKEAMKRIRQSVRKSVIMDRWFYFTE